MLVPLLKVDHCLSLYIAISGDVEVTDLVNLEEQKAKILFVFFLFFRYPLKKKHLQGLTAFLAGIPNEVKDGDTNSRSNTSKGAINMTKRIYTSYRTAVNWLNGNLILCNDIPQIDASIWDEIRFDLDDEEGNPIDICQFF